MATILGFGLWILNFGFFVYRRFGGGGWTLDLFPILPPKKLVTQRFHLNCYDFDFLAEITPRYQRWDRNEQAHRVALKISAIPAANLPASVTPVWPIPPNNVIMPQSCPPGPTARDANNDFQHDQTTFQADNLVPCACLQRGFIFDLRPLECSVASRTNRPNGEGFCSQTRRNSATSSRVWHDCTAVSISDGTTLRHCNATPRSTMKANPTTEVRPSNI